MRMPSLDSNIRQGIFCLLVHVWMHCVRAAAWLVLLRQAIASARCAWCVGALAPNRLISQRHLQNTTCASGRPVLLPLKPAVALPPRADSSPAALSAPMPASGGQQQTCHAALP